MSIVAMFISCGAGALARVPLSFFRCPLRRLQRINRRRASKSAALSRRLLRFRNDQVSAIRAGHAALDYQQVVVFLYAQCSQIAHGYARIAHVSRHPHSLKHARWKRRRANRTGNLKHRTMRLRAAAKMMALYHTLKSFALADANNVYESFALENINQHAVTSFYSAVRLSLFVH